MTKKKVILINNENEDLYKFFKRALKTITDINVIRYNGKFGNKQKIVVFILENNHFYTWLWSEFRTKALNPLIVIGLEDKSFFISKNPVFATYKEEHAYFQIPFDLKNLITTIERLKPIYDHTTRKLIVADYAKGYEHKLITHDLKIIKGDKKTTIDNFFKVKEFYASKGERKLVNFLNNKLELLTNLNEWEDKAVEIKEFLEQSLKT
jgi:hypothetical protein